MDNLYGDKGLRWILHVVVAENTVSTYNRWAVAKHFIPTHGPLVLSWLPTAHPQLGGVDCVASLLRCGADNDGQVAAAYTTKD